MDAVQMALVRRVRADQCLNGACLLDLAGEHRWVEAFSCATSFIFRAHSHGAYALESVD